MKNTKRLNDILAKEYKINDCWVAYDKKIKKYKIIHIWVNNNLKFYHNFFVGKHKDCENFIRNFFTEHNLKKLLDYSNNYSNWGCDSHITKTPKNPKYGI